MRTAVTLASVARPLVESDHDKDIVDVVSIVFGRCLQWARNTHFYWHSCIFMA